MSYWKTVQIGLSIYYKLSNFLSKWMKFCFDSKKWLHSKILTKYLGSFLMITPSYIGWAEMIHRNVPRLFCFYLWEAVKLEFCSDILVKSTKSFQETSEHCHFTNSFARTNLKRRFWWFRSIFRNFGTTYPVYQNMMEVKIMNQSSLTNPRTLHHFIVKFNISGSWRRQVSSFAYAREPAEGAYWITEWFIVWCFRKACSYATSNNYSWVASSFESYWWNRHFDKWTFCFQYGDAIFNRTSKWEGE